MAVAYKDYYRILGVEKSADAKAIKQAFRRLARKHHPDQNPGNAQAAERFKEANEANEVLSDPEKRRRYDTLGPDWQRYGEAAPGGGAWGADPGDFRVHVEPGGDGGDFSEFFRTIFGDLGRSGRPPRGGRAGDLDDRLFGRGARWPQRGDDVETAIEVTLEEVVQGTRRTLELQRREDCAACGGTGRQGKGPCGICGGVGEVGRAHRVEVKIPAGVREGSRVRAAGEGGGGASGGPRGDLYLRVRLLPHPSFERREDDIHVDLTIALWEAALGAEVEVPTLRGQVTMKIPPETSSGKTFRLPGYGVPHLRGGGQGDEFVHVKLVTPTGVTARERELFEELRQLDSRRGSLRPPPRPSPGQQAAGA